MGAPCNHSKVYWGILLSNDGGIMKYLITILSVLGVITIGTTLAPFVVDGVEFTKVRYSSAVGRVEGPAPMPVSALLYSDLC